jgi:hypothetical protein
MTGVEILLDAFGRIGGIVHDAVDGLTDEELSYQLDAGSNPIAWLVWHLARVQDDHVAAVASSEQVWTAAHWVERFGLDLPVSDIGYGHHPAQVRLVTAEPATLLGYYDAVEVATLAFVRGLRDDDLDRVVDTRWNPPVTLGVRLMSVVGDDVAHAAQAAYVRGIIERR